MSSNKRLIMELLSSRVGCLAGTMVLAPPAAYLLLLQEYENDDNQNTTVQKSSISKSSSSPLSWWTTTTTKPCRLDPPVRDWSGDVHRQEQPPIQYFSPILSTPLVQSQQRLVTRKYSDTSGSSSSMNQAEHSYSDSDSNTSHGSNQQQQQDDDDINSYPNLTRHGKDSLLRRYLTPRVYQQLRHKRTKLGIQLEDMIRSGVALPWGAKPPRGIAGVYCGDAECYSLFGTLLNPLIQHQHRAGVVRSLQRHRTNLDYKRLLQQRIDPAGEYILYTRMRLARSVRGFRFAPCITRRERRQIEALLRECSEEWNNDNDDNDDDTTTTDNRNKGDKSNLPTRGADTDNNHKKKQKQGRYMSVMEMSNSQHEDLVHRRILFPDPDEFAISAGFHRDWPDARGVYYDTWHQDHPNLMIWCNAWDHFWIISDAKGGHVQDVFTRLSKATRTLETSLQQRGYAFVEHPRLGFLNASPADIGTALRASVYVKLVRLGQRPDFQDIIRHLRLEAHQKEDSSRYTGIFDIGNAEALGKSEVELINIVISGVGTLIELEKKLEHGQDIEDELPRAIYS